MLAVGAKTFLDFGTQWPIEMRNPCAGVMMHLNASFKFQDILVSGAIQQCGLTMLNL